MSAPNGSCPTRSTKMSERTLSGQIQPDRIAHAGRSDHCIRSHDMTARTMNGSPPFRGKNPAGADRVLSKSNDKKLLKKAISAFAPGIGGSASPPRRGGSRADARELTVFYYRLGPKSIAQSDSCTSWINARMTLRGSPSRRQKIIGMATAVSYRCAAERKTLQKRMVRTIIRR